MAQTALLAIAPIALILALMLGLRWSAAAAGIAGLLLTAAVSFAAFGANAVMLGGAALEAIFITGTILWIIFPALSLHELQTRSGAYDAARQFLLGFAARKAVAAVLVAWFFALFVEGAAGFGTPVALAAPLLVTLGFAPAAAVSMALLGHAAGVSFGAVGTPVVLQLSLVTLDPRSLSGAIALMHAAFAWMLLLWVLRIAREAGGGDARSLAMALGASAAFVAPAAATAFLLGPELPTIAGALFGATAFVLFQLRQRRAGPARSTAGAGRELLRAGTPYLIIVGLILTTRLPPPVREVASAIEWRWTAWGEYEGAFQPLYHPGTILLLGFLLGGLMQRAPALLLRQAAAAALGRLPLVALALVAMLTLSRLMLHSGMVDAMAAASASAFGAVWPLLVPIVGALGTFVTGSATASNILFTDFQASTGAALGLPILLVVAGQCFGAAVGNVLCPHNIIAGAAAVGLVGREGDILRRTLIPGLLYALLGGAALWLMASLAG